MSTAAAWQQHRTSVYRYLRRRLSSREQAEDLTQETFLRLHRAPPQAKESTQLRAWLLRTAHNLIVDFYRARRDDVPLEEAEAVAEAAPSLRSLEPCIAPLAAKLPEGYRSALLWDLDGIAQQEIARRQSVSLSGAKSRVQRARALLQREFERCCRYHFDADGVLLAYTPRSRVDACE
jgi:RNA polymerase sigma-70 factor (ECF subfamily)